MIRDLTEISIDMTRQEKIEEVAEKAELNVEERILDLLLPPPRSVSQFSFDSDSEGITNETDAGSTDENFQRSRKRRKKLARQARQPHG